MDSVGIGELPDASQYGDQGSNTVGNIVRRVPLSIPTLRALGLGRVAALGDIPCHDDQRGDRMVRQAHHKRPRILSLSKDAVSAGSAFNVGAAAGGRMAEASPGSDPVTGHWGLM